MNSFSRNKKETNKSKEESVYLKSSRGNVMSYKIKFL